MVGGGGGGRERRRGREEGESKTGDGQGGGLYDMNRDAALEQMSPPSSMML